MSSDAVWRINNLRAHNIGKSNIVMKFFVARHLARTSCARGTSLLRVELIVSLYKSSNARAMSNGGRDRPGNGLVASLIRLLNGEQYPNLIC